MTNDQIINKQREATRYTEEWDDNRGQECLCFRRPVHLGVVAAEDGEYVDYESYKSIQEQLESAEKRVRELEEEALDEIEKREEIEAFLDDICSEIARYFEGDIGEHSSANDPWLEALELIPEYTLNKFAIEQQIKGVSESIDLYEKFDKAGEPLGVNSVLLTRLGELEQLRAKLGGE